MGKNLFTYRDKMETRESLTAFIDILGFSQILKNKSANSKLELEFLHDFSKKTDLAYSAISNIVKRKIKTGEEAHILESYSMRRFTDNILIGCPIVKKSKLRGKFELDTILLNISTYQFLMAANGYFTRGGLSIGNLYMDENTIFGYPIVEAYKIESEVALNPRIVLSADVMKLILTVFKEKSEQENFYFHNQILLDEDGNFFVNYLSSSIFEENDEAEAIQLIENYKENIIKGMADNRKNERVHSKYVWLARYHNYFFRGRFSEELLIETPFKDLCPIEPADFMKPEIQEALGIKEGIHHE
jgi:hypothetical protein